MITYFRLKPFPKCQYCDEQMDYWIPGQDDKDAAHPYCAGVAAFERSYARFLSEKRDTD